MKILHLTTQNIGGAGRAAVRLHQALLKQGIDSKMIVQNKIDDQPHIYSLTETRLEKLTSPLRMAIDQSPTLFYKHKKNDIFSSTFFPSNKKLLKKIQDINPDIIHLHWINSGFINVFDLKKMNKPILWSLHDANPYTGGCHVVEKGCSFFQNQCHACPMLLSKNKYDLSFFNFQRKKKAYQDLDLVVNGLSRWIANNAKSSSLFENKRVINIPNTIDCNVFYPIQQNMAQKLLGIIQEKKYIIGFGAVSATQIDRKGYPQLLEALSFLPNKEDYLLVVFGSSQGEKISNIDTLFLGHLYDDITLSLLYSALDLFIAPSLAENLSNTIMESLACNTPVVAFDVGGNSDMIIHKLNGYLAQNTQDLSTGILWSLANLKSLKNHARSTIVQKFDYNVVAAQYIQQYYSMIKNQKR